MIHRFTFVFGDELLFNIRSTSSQLENLKTKFSQNFCSLQHLCTKWPTLFYDALSYRKKIEHNFSETETAQ